MTIGIIGYGRFGQILTKHISKLIPQDQIQVSSRKGRLSLPRGISQVSFKTATASDVVIPCVPISQFESVIKAIKPHLKPNALVVDVCTVKSHPVKIMKRHLPKTVSILATHPMWGPDSAKASLKNLTTVVCPIRTPESLIPLIKTRAQGLNHRVVIMSPKRHDQLLAKSQALTHLYGRLNEQLGIKSTSIDTSGFKQLLKIQSFVVNDTKQLFQDMFRYNPYAKNLLTKLRLKLDQIQTELT